MQAILEQNLLTETAVEAAIEPAGKKIGIIGALFGCWHKQLTRPFSDLKSSYCVCLECGARKTFDTRTFKTSGAFYFPKR